MLGEVEAAGDHRRVLTELTDALATDDSDQAQWRINRLPAKIRYWAGAEIATWRAVHGSADVEQIARSISDRRERVQVLATVARRLAALDPDLGQVLFTEAIRTAHRFEAAAYDYPDPELDYPDPEHGAGDRVWGLALVADNLAALDPDRSRVLFAEAERMARSVIQSSRSGRWPWSQRASPLTPYRATPPFGDGPAPCAVPKLARGG